MGAADFSFEFHSEVPNLDLDLQVEAEQRLRALAKGHTDLTGADIALEPIAQAEFPFKFRARVVVYIRPNYLAASEQAETPSGALKGALEAIERQIREQRERLRERWKQP